MFCPCFFVGEGAVYMRVCMSVCTCLCVCLQLLQQQRHQSRDSDVIRPAVTSSLR